MNNIQVGQLWKSKNKYPNVGYYTVEIVSVEYDIVATRFTASAWTDKHWVENNIMTIDGLIENYKLLDK